MVELKILYVAYFFPPTTAVAGRRFRHLAASNEAIYTQQFALTNEEKEVTIKGVNTISVGATDLRSLTIGRGATKAYKCWWYSFIPRLRQAYPFLLLTDDGGPQYRRKTYQKAIALIEKHGITTVFSSFRPWSDHLVARLLKKKFPNLYWIADFRDLPVDPVRKDVWWPALQTWWGKRQVRPADELWCVSGGQAAQFEGWHPNIKVVRNALLELPPARTAPVTDRFTVVYTGSVYPGLQSVEPLVSALRNLLSAGTMEPDKLCLVYRGKDVEVFRQWTASLPAGCLDIQPSIAPAAAQKMQRNAQMLLLLNWSAPDYYGVLTAKLWDYLATGRPILALVNGPGDEELEGIVLGANAGAVFRDGEQGRLTKYLAKKYKTWLEAGMLSHESNLEKLREYL